MPSPGDQADAPDAPPPVTVSRVPLSFSCHLSLAAVFFAVAPGFLPWTAAVFHGPGSKATVTAQLLVALGDAEKYDALSFGLRAQAY